jgi:hypothetical protein
VIDTEENRLFLFDLHGPFGLLAIFNPLTYPAQAASVAANLVTSNAALKLMGHYSTIGLPVAAWAAIEGLALLHWATGRVRRGLRPAWRFAPEWQPAALLVAVILPVAMVTVAWDRSARAEWTLMHQDSRERYQAPVYVALAPFLSCVGEDDYFAGIDQLVGHVPADRITWPGLDSEKITLAIVPTLPVSAIPPEFAAALIEDLTPDFDVYRLADPASNVVLARKNSPVAACVAALFAASPAPGPGG